MVFTLLEVTREAHEDMERLERLAVCGLQVVPADERERVLQHHRIRNILNEIVVTSGKLAAVYEDKDGARKDEISNHLSAPTQSGVMDKFYEYLKEIHDYHWKNDLVPSGIETDDYEKLLTMKPAIQFTGEESFGRYLDLHELYNEFINSKFGSVMKYSAYVDTFAQTEKIPHNLKANRQYKEYLEHVLKYLTSFLYRTEPLQDSEMIFTQLATEFEKQWANGEVPGWESKGRKIEVVSQESAVDLDYYNTAQELVALGAEKLKEALTARGLKCGGTVQQRAERLFLLKEEVQADSESGDEDQQIYNPLKLPMGLDGKPISYWLYKLHGLGQELKCEICGNHSFWGRRAYMRHFKEWRY